MRQDRILALLQVMCMTNLGRLIQDVMVLPGAEIDNSLASTRYV